MFGTAKLNKNTDPDKHSYPGYGIGFDSCSLSSHSNFDFAKNVIIFGVDNSSSVRIDNKRKDILVLGESPMQGLDNTTITAEAKYSINFTISREKICLSPHFNGSSSFLFVNAAKYINSKQKIVK